MKRGREEGDFLDGNQPRRTAPNNPSRKNNASSLSPSTSNASESPSPPKGPSGAASALHPLLARYISGRSNSNYPSGNVSSYSAGSTDGDLEMLGVGSVLRSVAQSSPSRLCDAMTSQLSHSDGKTGAGPRLRIWRLINHVFNRSPAVRALLIPRISDAIVPHVLGTFGTPLPGPPETAWELRRLAHADMLAWCERFADGSGPLRVLKAFLEANPPVLGAGDIPSGSPVVSDS